MRNSSPLKSATLLLGLAAAFVAVLSVRDRAGEPSQGGGPLPPDCQGLSPEECRALLAPGAPQHPIPPEERALSASEVCINVGYLCADVEREGSLRLLRWPEDTPQILVWIPEPPQASPQTARDLQRAAVRGIQAWSGHPFPLSIQTRQRGGIPDVTVEWVRSLGGGRLGHAQVEWIREGEEIRLTVKSLALVTHHPYDSDREMTPEEITLVAAHEMGHALGLPHSDDPRDLMYPQNTAARLSSQDYKTLEAVYSLPNGAEIRR